MNELQEFGSNSSLSKNKFDLNGMKYGKYLLK